ncbi:MAG: hypothetical protein R6X02_30880 [Enhygromyxa sp.]
MPLRSRLRSFASALAGLLAVPLAIAWPRAASAIEYEVFIDVDTYDELNELWVNGMISEDTFNTLVELQRRGVDLNRANREQLYSLPNLTYDDVDRILAYRTEAGVIHTPSDLVAGGVLSREKLGSILMFIQGHDRRSKLTATHGWINYQTAWSQEDSTVPPMTLQARVTTLRQLTLGFAGLVTRQRPGDPIYDPNRDALMAGEMRPRVNVPKFYAQWDTEQWGVIAGSYRVGFGQRLTFDNTDRYTPNGFYLDDAIFRYNDLGVACRESQGELSASPCAGAAGSTYVTKDFRWRDSLRGVALGAKHLSLPVGWLQIYGFGSWQSRQVYQYEIYDRSVCDDPRSTDDACSAPDVYVSREGASPLEPTSTHKFQTLPNMVDELLGGANVSWFYDRRTRVGLTGYGATALWKVEGADLDFQEWSRTPFGGSWGAIGADVAWGHQWSDLGVEVARSFDSMKRVTGTDSDYGGGGFAGIVRHTSTFGANEIELSARYYDQAYANPYAGPIAQPDAYHGNRARDEAGGRIRYGGRIAKRLDLRALADFWVQPTQGSPKTLMYVRGDVDVNKWFRPGLWLQYRNVDLRPDSRVGCYTTEEAEENDPNPDGTIDYRTGCLAEVGQITGRLAFRPLKNKLSITAQYQHELIDDPRVSGRLRQDAAAMLIVRANPISSFRIAARLRYLFEDIEDNTRYQQSAWAYLDLSYVIKKLFLMRLRYDAFIWLDERDNTLARIPSPEHRLRLELEVRF